LGLFQKPDHSVNYLESHDGYTLGDFIRLGLGDLKRDQIIKDVNKHVKLTPQQLKLNKLAALFLFTSRGITMIHSGQEFARSKVIPFDIPVDDPHKGMIDHNTYDKDNETNYINYKHAQINKELFDYYKGLIELRKKYEAFRRADYRDVKFVDHKSKFMCEYFLKYKDEEFFIIINADTIATHVHLGPTVEFDVLVDENSAGVSTLRTVSESISIPPSSGMVLKKKQMKSVTLNIFPFVLLAGQINSQQFSIGSPEWLVDTFFRAENFPAKAEYYTGEMLNDIDKKTIGEELKGSGEVLFHQIKATNEEYAFAVEVKTDEPVIDFYFYLTKVGDEWKINAVRRFLFPSFVYTVYDSLLNLQTLSYQDSLLYRSLGLFLMNDSELKSYFGNHLNQLNNLVWYFNQKENNEVDKLLSNLGCNAVFRDTNFPGCLFVQISSFDKMESGFIYTSGSFKLPDISYKDFVYLEEVSDGWYIYRIM
jgi:hypothetical protein